MKDMQLNRLNHLQKETKDIQTIGDNCHCRRRRLEHDNIFIIKFEYDCLVGELSQTTIDAGTREIIITPTKSEGNISQ